MDQSLHELRDRIFKTLESRIPYLSKRAEKTRIPSWIWPLTIAIGLAVWADHGSREEGRMAWLQANPPRLEAWQAILFEHGFGPIQDPAWREKEFIEMPDLARRKASAMISEDHTVFALRTESDWLYFGLARMDGSGGKSIPRALWEPLGTGWEAFGRFDSLSFPDFSSKPNKSTPKRNLEEDADPRRLDY